MKKIAVFMLELLFASACLGKPVLPAVFSDHMVLQQERPVPVWGRAGSRSGVTVQFAGQEKTAIADQTGVWQVVLDPMEASSQPRTLVVCAEESGEMVEIHDVLVGEVWLCSGQSNMEWPLDKSEDYHQEIVAADRPEIRLFKIPRTVSAVPQENVDALWKVCSPESAASFSGVAYYFGKKISRELDVPVGLIQSAWGGTGIACWVAPEGFDVVSALSNVRAPSRNPQLTGDEKTDRQRPSVLYNGMIAPCVPFAMRGVLWYQGEANRLMGKRYLSYSKALIDGWRQLWGYDFPFYFVQIAPFRYGDENPELLPVFWETQADIVKTISRVGMAVVSDTATVDNIHPPNKIVPGTRLALLAQEHTYGMDVISSGPVFHELEREKEGLRVTFNSADGLTTRDGKDPDWFEIAGSDGIFKPAKAKIQGSAVVLMAPDVKDPQAARFGWHKLAKPNLMNGAGLPAAPFRTGDISE